MNERKGNTMEQAKAMSPELLRTAYAFGSECYWELRESGNVMKSEWMDRLIAIADELLLSNTQAEAE